MSTRRRRLSCVLVAALLAHMGCATTPTPRAGRAPESPPGLSTITALGPTGLVVVGGTPDPLLTDPPSGWKAGAGRGAAAGALASVVAGTAVGTVVVSDRYGWCSTRELCGGVLVWLLGWTAAGLALAPVGAAVGAVVGAVQAAPPEQIRRARSALIEAVAAADLPRIIGDGTLRLASERSWHSLVPMSGQGPEAADRDVGTVLELSIRRVGLEARVTPGEPAGSVWFSRDPELQLRLDVEARLLKAADGAVLYTGSFQELGVLRKFSDWAADDGRAFRDGLTDAAERVADRIAAAVFPGPEPWAESPDAEPRPEPGEQD